MIDGFLKENFGKWGILITFIALIISFVINSLNSSTIDRLINYNIQYTYKFEYDNLTKEQKLLVIIKNSGYSNSSLLKIDIESLSSSISEIIPMDTINLQEIKHFVSNPFLHKTYQIKYNILPSEYIKFEFALHGDVSENSGYPSIKVFSDVSKVIYSKEVKSDTGFNFKLLRQYFIALFLVIVFLLIPIAFIIALYLLVIFIIKKIKKKFH